MAGKTDDVEFVVKPVPTTGGASEFRQSMRPHPLVYQELHHDPQFGIYNGRLRSLSYGNAAMEDLYWRLRRQVMLSHTGELATEIRGPEAEALLDQVFTRSVAAVRVGRCSYQIACYDDGGVMMDGVLMRFAPDHFWYVQSDGEFHGWLRAHAGRFAAAVRVTDVWISQVQGPRSMDVLAEVADEGLPERFRYFDMATIRVGGQPLVITRTGFTNELGWEFYLEPGADIEAIGERILEVGKQYDMDTTPAEVTNARRIEGGLLFAGTDFDPAITPYEAGFGAIVDLDKGPFAGREALLHADQRSRTWGLTCPGGTPCHGPTLQHANQPAGRVTSSAWSPTLQTGIAIVRMDDPELGPGSEVDVRCTDGQTHPGVLASLPLYDKAGDIPRGRGSEMLTTPEAPHAVVG